MNASLTEFLVLYAAVLVGGGLVLLALYCLGFLRIKTGLTFCRWRDFGATRDAPPDELVKAASRVRADGFRFVLGLIWIGALMLGQHYGWSLVRGFFSSDAYVGRTIGFLLVGVVTTAASFAIGWLVEYGAIRHSLAKARLRTSQH